MSPSVRTEAAAGSTNNSDDAIIDGIWISRADRPARIEPIRIKIISVEKNFFGYFNHYDSRQARTTSGRMSFVNTRISA